MASGKLRVYLGAAPGVGKTYAMLAEDLGPGGHHITLDTPEDLPDVIAGAALLTRVLTSMMADALNRSPADAPPTLTAAIRGSQVEIRVTDRGPGPDQGNGDGLARPARRQQPAASPGSGTWPGPWPLPAATGAPLETKKAWWQEGAWVATGT